MLLFTFFFAAAHFHLVSISSFSHRRFKTFQFIFQRNRSLLCPFFFCPFSVIHVNVDMQNLSLIGFVVVVVIVIVVVFISKSPGSYAIYRRNAWVPQRQNFIPAYTNGWTYVYERTIFSEPQILRFIDY